MKFFIMIGLINSKIDKLRLLHPLGLVLFLLAHVLMLPDFIIWLLRRKPYNILLFWDEIFAVDFCLWNKEISILTIEEWVRYMDRKNE